MVLVVVVVAVVVVACGGEVECSSSCFVRGRGWVVEDAIAAAGPT